MPRGRVLAVLAAVLVLAVAVTVGLAIANRPVPLTVRNLRIAVTDGPAGNQHVSLDATLYLPPAPAGPAPAVLVAHGFGGSKASVTRTPESSPAVVRRPRPGRPAGSAPHRADRAGRAGRRGRRRRRGCSDWLADPPGGAARRARRPAGRRHRRLLRRRDLAAAAAAYDRRVDAIAPRDHLERPGPRRCSRTRPSGQPPAAGPAAGAFGPGRRSCSSGARSAGLSAAAGRQPAERRRPAAAPSRPAAGSCRSVCAGIPSGRGDHRPADARRPSRCCAGRPGRRWQDRITVPDPDRPGRAGHAVRPGPGRRQRRADRGPRHPGGMVWFAGGHDGGDQEAPAPVTQLVRPLAQVRRPARSRDRPPPPPRACAATADRPPAFAVTRAAAATRPATRTSSAWRPHRPTPAWAAARGRGHPPRPGAALARPPGGARGHLGAPRPQRARRPHLRRPRPVRRVRRPRRSRASPGHRRPGDPAGRSTASRGRPCSRKLYDVAHGRQRARCPASSPPRVPVPGRRAAATSPSRCPPSTTPSRPGTGCGSCCPRTDLRLRVTPPSRRRTTGSPSPAPGRPHRPTRPLGPRRPRPALVDLGARRRRGWSPRSCLLTAAAGQPRPPTPTRHSPTCRCRSPDLTKRYQVPAGAPSRDLSFQRRDAARCSACSARTAPARPPRCAC